MRVFVGGVPVTVPARWYFAPEGAKVFPGPHGAEASVWLKQDEVNDDWGEVTPYPQDPASQVYRGLDRGLNPGYAGQCSVGDPQWFVDGMLPADILTRPPAPYPACCRPPVAVAQGGIVLGGSALSGRGGIVGTCLLCPGGAPRQWLLTASGGTGSFSAINGQHVLSYFGGCTWNLGSPLNVLYQLVGRLTPSPTWTLTLQRHIPATGAQYNMPGWSCISGGAGTLTSSSGSGVPPSVLITS